MLVPLINSMVANGLAYSGYMIRGKHIDEIIYVFLTIFLYLLKCPQSLIL